MSTPPQNEIDPKDIHPPMSPMGRAFTVILIEYFFVILPFLVILLCKFLNGQPLGAILASSDVAMASIILNGTVIIRMVSATVLMGGIGKEIERHAVAFLVLLMLIIINCIVYVKSYESIKESDIVMASKLGMFIITSFVHFMFGLGAQFYIVKYDKR